MVNIDKHVSCLLKKCIYSSIIVSHINRRIKNYIKKHTHTQTHTHTHIYIYIACDWKKLENLKD